MKNPLANTTEFLASEIMRSPRQLALGVSTALLVPFVFDSDDRGYLNTALITTPLVAAAFEIAPILARNSLVTAAKVKDYFQVEKAVLAGPTDAEVLRHMMQERSAVPFATAQEKLGEFVRNAPDFRREETALSKYFDRLMKRARGDISDIALPDQSRNPTTNLERYLRRVDAVQDAQEHFYAREHRLLSNAIQASERALYSPEQWSQAGSDPVGRVLSLEEMEKIVEEKKADPRFVRELNGRLRRMRGLSDEGGARLPQDFARERSVQSFTSKEATGILDQEFSSGFERALALLEKQRPQVARDLRSGLRNQNIEELTLVAEKDASGELERVVTADIKLPGEKPVSLPIFDPQTGQVSFGGEHVGVGRYMIGPSGNPLPIDEWVAYNVAHGQASKAELLKNEIAQGAYFSAVDPKDVWRQTGAEDARLRQLMISMRSKGVVISDLPIFGEKGDTTWSQLDPGVRERTLEGWVNKNLSAVVSESGPASGRLSLPQQELLSPFGLVSPNRQNETYRGLAKAVTLDTDQLRPAPVTTSYVQSLAGAEEIPRIQGSIRLAGIAPQYKSIFADLPPSFEEFQKGEFIPGALDKLRREGMTPAQSEAAVSVIMGRATDQATLDILRETGKMGETDYLLKQEFANKLKAAVSVRYEVNQVALKDLTAGRPLSAGTVVGFNNYDPAVLPLPGELMHVEASNREGIASVWVKHALDAEGAKLDAAGIKGLSVVVKGEDESFDYLRETLNQFFAAGGLKNRIAENVEGLVDLSYHQAKLQDLAGAQVNIASDLIRRLDKSAAGKAMVQPFISRLKHAGFDYDSDIGQLIADSSRLPVDPTGMLATRKLRGENLLQVSAMMEDQIKQVGEQLLQATTPLDSDLELFRQSGAKAEELFPWMLENSFEATLHMWDSTKLFVPHEIAVTPDMLVHMNLTGQYSSMREIKSRLQVARGDNNLTLELGKHMFERPDQVLGTEVPLEKAFVETGSLTKASVRAHSIFDPSLEAYQKNFTVALPAGAKKKYLFVPGSEAFGGRSNLYGAGEYETMEHMRTMMDLYRNRGDIAQVNTLAEKYEGEIEGLFLGKKNAFFPRSVDPLARPGFLQTRASRDPFTVAIGPDAVRKIGDRNIREALERGETTHAVLSRQPISYAPTVRVVMDRDYTANRVGMDEALRGLIYSDDDRDPVGLHFLRQEESIREAEATIAGQQTKDLEMFRALFGRGEESRRVSTKLKPFGERLKAQVESMVDLGAGVRRRTASAAIGELSNVTTRMFMEMELSPKLVNQREQLSLLRHVAFVPRQAPIWASKAHTHFGLEDALRVSRRLTTALDHPDLDTAVEETHAAMSEVLGRFGKARLFDPDMAAAGLKDTGGEINAALELWQRDGRSVLRNYMVNRDRSIGKSLVRVLTSEGEAARAQLPRILNNTKNLPSWLQPVLQATKQSWAEHSAEQLGKWNQAKTAARDVSRLVEEGGRGMLREVRSSGVGKVLGLGLGVAAAAGILSTSLGRPRELEVPAFAQPARQPRPEEAIGSQDQVPGEDVAGVLAPSNPPRRLVAPPPATRTSIVAPLNQASDVEVRMRAEDRSVAIETAKRLTQLSANGGQQNVNVNIRGNAQLNSLRTRERLRDLRDNS